jgi:hypothetical protein
MLASYRRNVTVALALILAAHTTLAQHTFERTKTVDKQTSGVPPVPVADFTSIQEALDSFDDDDHPITEKWTILIYAGTYAEAVTLGTNANGVDLVNVDLVGVDRDAVIIKPPGNTDAITISGSDARNNTIRNLTIETDDDTYNSGHGIVIKHAGTGGDPTGVKIVDVTIICNGDDSIGVCFPTAAEDVQIHGVTIEKSGLGLPAIHGHKCTRMRISECRAFIVDGNAVSVGDDCRITDSVIIVDERFGEGGGHDDTAAIKGTARTGLRVSGCKLEARLQGMTLSECSDVVVSDCELLGSHSGVSLNCGDDILFQNCTIVADSAKGIHQTPYYEAYNGVQIGAAQCEPGSIRFVGCRIRAHSAIDNHSANGVYVNAAPDPSDGPVQFIDCSISSDVTVIDEEHEHQARAFGVVGDEADAVALIGGSVTSSDADEREDDQFDLANNAASGLGIRVSGTKLSKWKGPIGAAGRQKSVVQRTIDVAAPSAVAILASTPLTEEEQPNVTPDHQPDVYRVLSVRGKVGGMTQDVYIVGTDWGGNPITDKITLDGTTNPVEGVKPFKTVDHIILPARSAIGQQVSVGTTTKLGLQFPISAVSDVQQLGKKASNENSYTLISIGQDAVDAVYATVDVGTIAADDSFEWAVLASE